jgi:hypothetical protein
MLLFKVSANCLLKTYFGTAYLGLEAFTQQGSCLCMSNDGDLLFYLINGDAAVVEESGRS